MPFPCIATDLVHALAFPADGDAGFGKGALHEFAHRVGFAGREHVIITLCLLKDAPHALNIIARMPPVPLRIEIAEIEHILQAVMDGGYGARDLARHEGFTTQGAFVIEEDAVRGMNAIGLAVIDGDPIGIELCSGVGRTRIEGRGFTLRHVLRLAVEFGGRGLVETRPAFEFQDADASSRRSVPIASALAVYSAVSKLTCTWDCAARL